MLYLFLLLGGFHKIIFELVEERTDVHIKTWPHNKNVKEKKT